MRKHFTLETSSELDFSGKSVGSPDPKPLRRRRTGRYHVSPSELAIRNILNYSLALSVLPTQDPGLNSMLMN